MPQDFSGAIIKTKAECKLKYFYCYDMNLFNYLKSKGFRFVTKARHHKTGDLFSLYERDEQLNQALSEWESHKQKIIVKNGSEGKVTSALEPQGISGFNK